MTIDRLTLTCSTLFAVAVCARLKALKSRKRRLISNHTRGITARQKI